MEWFSTANANLPASELQRHIRVETLHEWCASPPAIPGDVDKQGLPDWTRWRVHREVIPEDLHFTLPGATPTLQWTLTAGGHARPGTVTLHCTLATATADAARVLAVENFVRDWTLGLEAGVQRLQDLRAAKRAAVCESYASSGFG